MENIEEYETLKTKIVEVNRIMISFLRKERIRDVDLTRILLQNYIDKIIELKYAK